MLNLPQQTLDKIKTLLIKQQKQVDAQIKELDKDDPVLLVDAVAEVSESGTESWQAEVHTRLQTLKNDLIHFSQKIKQSILRINQGTYGRCEKCKKQIEAERLHALPTASLCLACSKKSSGR